MAKLPSDRLRRWAAALALTSACLSAGGVAHAAVTSAADSGGSVAEIGARLRWGNTGFEASLFDASPFAQSPTINPPGTPAWTVGTPYHFELGYTVSTGTLSLTVLGQTVSQNVFAAPGQSDYSGYSFNYLSISGNESGSTARSQIANLTINGTAFGPLAPVGTFQESFFRFSPLATDSIVIAGDLTFLTAGTAQERPSWNFNFEGSAIASGVPEPSTWAMMLLGFAGLSFFGWRRRMRVG